MPVGKYTREMFRRLERRPGFPPAYGDSVLANVVSQEENVKSVVAKVQLGEADAGVVYRSDVTPRVAPSVTVLEIPDDANVLASYPIAVLTGTADSARGQGLSRAAPGSGRAAGAGEAWTDAGRNDALRWAPP